MLLTTALLTLTPAIQGPLPPQNSAPGRTPTHFRCLRIDDFDQACVMSEARTEVFDFMTMNMQSDVDGPMSHWSDTLAHTAVASASTIGGATTTSQLLATALNITPRGRSTYVPQVTANLYGRVTSANPDFSTSNFATWSIESMSAGGNYQILPRPNVTSETANLHYVLYAYCIGQDPSDAFDPANLTTISLNASNSNLLLTNIGPGAGWQLQGSLERSNSSNPNAAPEMISMVIPETFNEAWVGTQAVAVGPNGGGNHTVSFNVSQANAMLMMPQNQIDAGECSIGGSASFHVRTP